jgi:hypothetical protein
MATRYAHLIVYDDGAAVVFTPYDEAFVNTLKDYVPKACRKWLPSQKTWIVDADYVTAVRLLAGEHFDEVIMAHTAPAPSAPPTHTLNDCLAAVARRYPHHRALGLWPGVPLALVESAYRSIAKLVHPDVRGEAGARKMVEANAAYEALRGVLAATGRP